MTSGNFQELSQQQESSCLNFCCHPHLSQVFQQDDITPITTACLHRRRVQKSQVVGLFKMVFTFCCESNVDIWKSQHIDLIYILHDMAAFLELEKQTQTVMFTCPHRISTMCLSSSTRFFSALSCFTL